MRNSKRVVNIKSSFDSVVAVAFKIVFARKCIKIIFLKKKKLIFDTSTSKRSKNIK